MAIGAPAWRTAGRGAGRGSNIRISANRPHQKPISTNPPNTTWMSSPTTTPSRRRAAAPGLSIPEPDRGSRARTRSAGHRVWLDRPSPSRCQPIVFVPHVHAASMDSTPDMNWPERPVHDVSEPQKRSDTTRPGPRCSRSRVGRSGQAVSSKGPDPWTDLCPYEHERPEHSRVSLAAALLGKPARTPLPGRSQAVKPGPNHSPGPRIEVAVPSGIHDCRFIRRASVWPPGRRSLAQP